MPDVVLLQEVYEFKQWPWLKTVNQLDVLQSMTGTPHKAWGRKVPFHRGVMTGVGGNGILSRLPPRACLRELASAVEGEHGMQLDLVRGDAVQPLAEMAAPVDNASRE